MYLAGGPDGENAELTNGVPVSDSEMFRDIGNPDDWRRRKPVRFRASYPPELRKRPPQAEKEILQALSVCEQWLRDS